MLTTAVLGLLNRNQILYATRMSRLVTFEDKQALLAELSDRSSSDSDSDPFNNKTSTKTAYYNNLAKDLIKSSSRVDKRFIKLHEMHAYPNQRTNLLKILGIGDAMRRLSFQKGSHSRSSSGTRLVLPRRVTSQSEHDSSQNHQESSEDSSSSVKNPSNLHREDF